MISRWVPGGWWHSLGTDGFGRSDTRQRLRSFFEVDRHYVTLAPYRAGRRNIFVVRQDSGILVRYAESTDEALVLQPRDPGFPAVVLPAASLTDVIVGRVAQVSLKAA